MKLHDTIPGEYVLKEVQAAIESYVLLRGKKPACIELTKEEFKALENYFKGFTVYLSRTETQTISGIPIYVN